MAEVLEAKKTPDFTNPAADNFVKPIPCPRCMNDVYSIGINLQYYIGDIYLKLAQSYHGDLKEQFKKLAVLQLEGKEQIQKLSENHLNELLCRFYNSGGAVIELPISKKQAKEIQPFFNRIIDYFFKQLDSSLNLASDNNMTADELEKVINFYIVDMYNSMGNLFQIDEINKAFDTLIYMKTTD